MIMLTPRSRSRTQIVFRPTSCDPHPAAHSFVVQYSLFLARALRTRVRSARVRFR